METIIKHSNRNYKIDQGRITLLDSRFYFTEKGKPVPSVTTVLMAYPKSPEFMEWIKKTGEKADEIRDEAGRKGSRVHALTEKYDTGQEVNLFDENGDFNLSLTEWGMFEKYVEFRRRFPMEIHATEQTIVSSALGFAGTLDRDITINNKRYLIDIKTSNNIWDEYWVQLVAYEKLKIEQLGANPYDGRAILWLNAKTKTEGKPGTFQGIGYQLLIDENNPEALWQEFKATQLLWNAKFGSMKPKMTSYNLKHSL